MFDETAYIILKILVVLTFLIIVFGIPLGDTILRKK